MRWSKVWDIVDETAREGLKEESDPGMNRLVRLTVLGVFGVGLVLGGAACGGASGGGTAVSGTIVEKDYDAPKTQRTRDCTSRYTSGARKGQCKSYGPYYNKTVKSADWDITVRDANGEEHEIEVSQDTYNRVNVGDSWPR